MGRHITDHLFGVECIVSSQSNALCVSAAPVDECGDPALNKIQEALFL